MIQKEKHTIKDVVTVSGVKWAKPTGNKIKALPVLRAGLDLAGQQVEFDRLPVGLRTHNTARLNIVGNTHKHTHVHAEPIGRSSRPSVPGSG